VSRSKSNDLLVVSLFLSLFVPTCLYSQTNNASTQLKAAESSYSAQDRRDPFESVYESKTKKTVPQSQQKEGYELEELKLVGVIKTGNIKFAMMEDAQGRGMLFKKGDFLNKNLWLLDIAEDKVVLATRLRGDIRQISMDIPRK
jgi:Tfp pilus assembly protein PilP